MDLHEFKQRAEHELRQNILPFWMNTALDRENGGFYGQVSASGVPDPNAPKGGILIARILWTFSHAYRLFKDPEYLHTAQHPYHFLAEKFWDPEFGGAYWLVDAIGQPLDMKKQIYAQGFTIYGLSEYSLATGEAAALEKARRLFELIEEHAYDPEHGGYIEGCSRSWQAAGEYRLSEKEQNDPKTMNTHLHILEPYTNLLRAWDSPRLREQQRRLIRTFLDRIIDPSTHHFQLFFSMDWQSRLPVISYGHDIEGSWLLIEAAQLLGEQELIAEVQQVALQMAQAVLQEATEPNGAVLSETDPNTDPQSNGQTKLRLHDWMEWWVLAEAVVGFLNAYQLSGDDQYLQASWKTWQFIEKYVVDHAHGEWLRIVDRLGRPTLRPLVDFWKCPYHNGRACMEVYERLHAA